MVTANKLEKLLTRTFLTKHTLTRGPKVIKRVASVTCNEFHKYVPSIKFLTSGEVFEKFSVSARVG